MLNTYVAISIITTIIVFVKLRSDSLVDDVFSNMFLTIVALLYGFCCIITVPIFMLTLICEGIYKMYLYSSR